MPKQIDQRQKVEATIHQSKRLEGFKNIPKGKHHLPKIGLIFYLPIKAE